MSTGTPPSRLRTLRQAVAENVPDGATVALGCGMEAMIPFAAGHEIIRQKKRDLTLVGPISDTLFDQIVAGGCARRIRAAWVGSVQMGSAYAFRRAVESGEVEMIDYTNFTMALALHAAALGVPFLPARSALGSDLPSRNPALRPFDCPLTSARLLAVEALAPDVAIIAVQRADVYGNAHLWGNLGIVPDAAAAARCVVAIAEEIVDPDVIASDPNRTLLDGSRVSAVVHEPGSCHPSPVPGHWNRDHAFFAEYHAATRTPEGARSWLDEWVTGVEGRAAYLEKLGPERLAALRPAVPAPAAPADFGI